MARLRSGVKGWLLTLLIACVMSSAPRDLHAQGGAVAEYQLKAVFLFNFAQFVDWPTAAFATTQTPIVIGVLGEDPFGSYLDETVRGERVNGRALVIQRYRRLDDIKNCQIVFVSRSEAARLDQIVTALKNRNILTVGDMTGFATHGGMIQFVTEQKKIRLRINVDAAKAADITVSSKLLRPAEIVTTESR